MISAKGPPTTSSSVSSPSPSSKQSQQAETAEDASVIIPLASGNTKDLAYQQNSKQNISDQFKRVPLQNMGSYLQLGHFRLLHTLGEGEFGKVKLAVDYPDQHQYAVKFVKKSLLENLDFKAKLFREIEILKSIDCPFVIKLHDVFECEKYVALIMEYASGGELFNHILARQHLTENEAKRYFAQLVLGLSELHSNRIVHRDMKLENLLLDADRNIKISDFGFANHFESDSNRILRTSCGSPAYAAPELVMSETYDGVLADVWSCGVILFAMLAGYLPFDDDPGNPNGQNISRLYGYIMRAKIRFPSTIRPDVRDLISKILVVDPNKRMNLDEVMAHRWVVREIARIKEEIVTKQIILGSKPETASEIEDDKENDNSHVDYPPDSKELSNNGLRKSLVNKNRPRSVTEPVHASPEQESVHDFPEHESVLKQQNSSSISSTFSTSPPSFLRSKPNWLRSSSDKVDSLLDPIRFFSFNRQSNELKQFNGTLDKRTITSTLRPTEMLDRLRETINGLETNTADFDSHNFSIDIHPNNRNILYVTCTRKQENDENTEPSSEEPSGSSSALNSGNPVFSEVFRKSWRTFISKSRLFNRKSDSIEHLKFSVQVCKFGGLNSVYCFEIRKINGDAWQFKRLYETMVDHLQFENS